MFGGLSFVPLILMFEERPLLQVSMTRVVTRQSQRVSSCRVVSPTLAGCWPGSSLLDVEWSLSSTDSGQSSYWTSNLLAKFVFKFVACVMY